MYKLNANYFLNLYYAHTLINLCFSLKVKNQNASEENYNVIDDEEINAAPSENDTSMFFFFECQERKFLFLISYGIGFFC